MSRNWTQGFYTPVNPGKYVGSGSPKYRSGWELTFMRFCDNNPNVISWGSECVRIPYRNPFTGKNTFYVPDFLITYQDKSGNKRAELIEIKPRAQVTLEVARSQQEKAAVVLNMAKWQAARAWCSRMGATFRILTEEDIFNKATPNRTRRK
jgi:hypothetical protein